MPSSSMAPLLIQGVSCTDLAADRLSQSQVYGKQIRTIRTTEIMQTSGTTPHDLSTWIGSAGSSLGVPIGPSRLLPLEELMVSVQCTSQP
ncbi:unnamed protein product [Cylicocyclus nassatus]|uniref:Uncharacterized protein n=1 Tax=Cylicocyclus nassatus TaxID=53992 RepID=A0AA36M5L1_CYLNA|nr:unnamed protein product [Cylicocyclus nassatus]